MTKLDNGLQVITIDNGGSVSRLAIGVEAGTRVEGAGQRGITHLLKNAAFQVFDLSSFSFLDKVQILIRTLACLDLMELLFRRFVQ